MRPLLLSHISITTLLIMSKQKENDFDEDLGDLDDDQAFNPTEGSQNSKPKRDFNFSSAFGQSQGGRGPGGFGGMPSFGGLDSFGGGMGGFGLGMGGGFGGGFGRFGSGMMGGSHGHSHGAGGHGLQGALDADFLNFKERNGNSKKEEQKVKIQEKKEPEETEEQKLARLTKKIDIPLEEQITIVDWAIRGPAQLVRMVLEFILVPYKQRKYVFTTQQAWFKRDKPLLQQKHPGIELPYIEDGQKIVYGTEAMIVYLLNKYQRTQLLGTSLQEKSRIATAASIYWDLLEDYYELCYGEYDENLNWDKAKQLYINQRFRVKLFRMVTFLKHPHFPSSAQFTWIDFAFAEIVSILNQMDSRFRDHNNIIQNYATRVYALPQFIVYKRSDRFHQRPYNGLGAIYK